MERLLLYQFYSTLILILFGALCELYFLVVFALNVYADILLFMLSLLYCFYYLERPMQCFIQFLAIYPPLSIFLECKSKHESEAIIFAFDDLKETNFHSQSAMCTNEMQCFVHICLRG